MTSTARPSVSVAATAASQAIGPDITAPDAVDGAGRLVLPAFVEPHVHLDKTLWGEAWQPGKRAAKLRDYIENERRVLSANTTPPEERAGRLLGQMLAYGTTAVRSHIDVAPGHRADPCRGDDAPARGLVRPG